ncbi:MAG: hypothetical protein ACOVP6_10125 [Lacibacter sp.]
MEKLIIFPFNGNGIEALDCIQDQYDFIGFIDDTPGKIGMSAIGYPVYDRSAISKYKDVKVLAVPGSPTSFLTRKSLIDELGLPNDRFARVIHSNASVSGLSVIGINTLVMAGVVLTSNCKIGNHVCILPNTTIHHDSIIEDYSLIGSGVTIAGNVTINSNCYIGSGTNIINGIQIGKQTIIGLGSNVLNGFPDNSKVYGNPAKLKY